MRFMKRALSFLLAFMLLTGAELVKVFETVVG